MPRDHRSHQSAVVVLVVIAAAIILPSAVLCAEPGLTLDQAIALSLNNARAQASRESVKQARGDVQTASLLPNPNLGVEVGLLPLGRPYTMDEPGGPPEIAAGLSYPVDWLLFGKRAAAVASAEAAVGLVEAEHADVIRRQVMETALTFYTVLENEALLEVARQTLGDLEQAEVAIRKATASGGRPRVELNRVRLELQSTRRDERSARSAVVEAKSALQALLGTSVPAGALEVVGTLDGPFKEEPLCVETALETAIENRPDLLALRRKVEKARLDEVVEGRNAWPETTLGFGVTHQFQRSIGAPDVTAWGATVEVALPLFDRNQGNRAKAASAVVQSARELDVALADLRAEVEQAVQSLEMSHENAMEMARTEVDLAVQVRDSFKKSYEAGGRSLLEMLDAQRSYRETYSAYITSRADYWRSLFRYYALLGKRVSP